MFAIMTGTPEHSAEFCRAREVPFECLTDRPGEPTYRAFGLAKVNLRTLFGPNLIESVWTLAKRFREVRNPKSGDVYQMSGSFVLDPTGVVRYAHRDAHPGDHAPSAEIWRHLDEWRAA